MNILFLSYWGIKEGLTQATVIPHLKILSSYDKIKKIILITIERETLIQSEIVTEITEHIPYHSKSYPIPLMDKFFDFIQFPKIISQIIINEDIDKIIARGSPAGALAYLVYKKTKTPFYVESFEPHADYMLETRVWKKWGIKYPMQKYWEAKQLQYASGLITVTEGYSTFLKSKYPKISNVMAAPCGVDMINFQFNLKDRKLIREELGFKENQIIGIYVGKFGGLYFDISELVILKRISEIFTNFGLIILSPIPEKIIRTKLKESNNFEFKIIIKDIPHYNVPKYLSAADFALSLNKSFASGKYLSPIKIGEYWANGLPVLLTEGIGDERNFLENENGGVQFNTDNLNRSLKKLDKQLKDPDHRRRIPQLAEKYRSFNSVIKAYENMIIRD